MTMSFKGLGPIVMLLVTALPVHAALYKWIDGHGVTQYSQEPPPSGHYQEMKMQASSPGSEKQPAQQQAQDTPPKQPEQDSAVAAPSNTPQDSQYLAKRQAAMRKNCQIARHNLSQLDTHGRIRYLAADGTMHVMTEEEKQAKLAENRQMVEEMCQ